MYLNLVIKNKSQFSNGNKFLFIAFQKKELGNFVLVIDIYQFTMIDIVYGIPNPRNRNEV